ncbi:MAG: hypothetical protein MUF07_11920 [Steroidobacteraceae bacterium]|jgi:hypothetical protein|nr:hypothetical protein [Steroidobacteraceae bacterium]
MSIWKKYGYAWVTAALFLVTLTGQWVAGWYAHVADQRAHQQAPEVREFVLELGRDTLENWQSEFLQLIWQVAGLSYLLYVGSPQSKEEDDRLEDKLDAILRSVDPANAERLIRALDQKYPGRSAGGG